MKCILLVVSHTVGGTISYTDENSDEKEPIHIAQWSFQNIPPGYMESYSEGQGSRN